MPFPAAWSSSPPTTPHSEAGFGITAAGMVHNSFLMPSHPASPSSSPSPKIHHEVGFESTATLIAQEQLNDARKAFLASGDLPQSHRLRDRINAADGSLLFPQLPGTPRKASEPDKIPKPQPRQDRASATYFLCRCRLKNMYLGKWTIDSDWEAWDRTREKMEEQLYYDFRLLDSPPAPRGILNESQKLRLKRKRMREKERAIAKEAELRRKRRRLEEKKQSQSFREEVGERVEEAVFFSPTMSFREEVQEPEAVNPFLTMSFREEVQEPAAVEPFPTMGDLMRATPLEGIRMEELLAMFWRPERAWDRERFCNMLHEIGTVDKSTKTFHLTLVEED